MGNWTLPVAKNADGSAITGASYEYISFDNGKKLSYRLAYAAAGLSVGLSLDSAKARAVPTRSEHLGDAPERVPDSAWEYANDRTIRLLPAGTAFQQSWIYEFSHIAVNPLVAGIGLAATRDLVSFLR